VDRDGDEARGRPDAAVHHGRADAERREVHEQVPAVHLGRHPPGDAGVQQRPVQRATVGAPGRRDDERQPVEVRQRHRLAPGERMAARDDEHLRVARDLARPQRPGRRVVRDDGDVHPPRGHRVERGLAVRGEHPQLPAGRGEPADAVTDHPAEGAPARGQRDRRGPEAQVGDQVGRLPPGVAREDGDALASDGEAERAAVALVQVDAEPGLQLADLRVQRRLAEVERPGGGGEVEVLGEDAERVDGVRLQRLGTRHDSTIGQTYSRTGSS
jgi:hypothetical protein